jgi:hypothetical protein
LADNALLSKKKNQINKNKNIKKKHENLDIICPIPLFLCHCRIFRVKRHGNLAMTFVSLPVTFDC